MTRETKEYDGTLAAASCWVETYTGRRFYLLQPRVEDVDIDDIAHSLSQLCRFTGHTREFYSVAQHSVLVSMHCHPQDALAGLMHDAAEAYLGDINRPLKNLLDPPVRQIEARLQQAIFAAFGLGPEIPESVHEADVALLLAEKRDLMNGLPWEQASAAGVKTYSKPIKPLGTFWAKKLFLSRFEELYHGGGAEKGYGFGV